MLTTPFSEINVFTTCPHYTGQTDRAAYLRRVIDVCRWSDEAGAKGMLIYTDNSVLDPWMLAQIAIQNTQALMPLVALQPVYLHPLTAAKAVSTIAYLYGRRMALNLVAGGFKNDLVAMNDTTPHDRRYDRLVEYTTIIERLLASPAPVTFEGEFYTVRNLALKPPLPAELYPFITISGSSPAGLAAARELNAVPVKYPEPAERSALEPVDRERGCGVRLGIIAREDEDAAWEVAYRRFPPDRAGQIAHGLAMKVSDSSWHSQLSGLAAATKQERSTYWLVPFDQYKTFCPYLVGSYARVAAEVGRYVAAGFDLFILDIPASREELEHIGAVFTQAQVQKAGA